MEEQVLKICNCCKEEKKLSEFHKRGNGLKGDCKDCRVLDTKKRYYKDHEETKRKKRLVWHKRDKLKTKLTRIMKAREL